MLYWIILYKGKIYIQITYSLFKESLSSYHNPIKLQKSGDNLTNYMKIRKVFQLGNYSILPKSLQLYIDICKSENHIDSPTLPVKLVNRYYPFPACL